MNTIKIFILSLLLSVSSLLISVSSFAQSNQRKEFVFKLTPELINSHLDGCSSSFSLIVDTNKKSMKQVQHMHLKEGQMHLEEGQIGLDISAQCVMVDYYKNKYTEEVGKEKCDDCYLAWSSEEDVGRKVDLIVSGVSYPMTIELSKNYEYSQFKSFEENSDRYYYAEDILFIADEVWRNRGGVDALKKDLFRQRLLLKDALIKLRDTFDSKSSTTQYLVDMGFKGGPIKHDVSMLVPAINDLLKTLYFTRTEYFVVGDSKLMYWVAE